MSDDIDRLEPGEIRSDGDAIREADQSWLEGLATERDERLIKDWLKIGIPGWGPSDDPDLALEFRVLPRERLEEFQKQTRQRQRKREKAPSNEASDLDIGFLVESCVGSWARNPETGKRVALVRDNRPVALTKKLGEILKLDPDGPGKDSRSLVKYLFATKDEHGELVENGIAIGAMALKVARWMTNTSADVEDELLGE